MKLRIYVDNILHEIDSTNPEILGKWVVEIFDRIALAGWTPATYVTVQAFPSFVLVDRDAHNDADRYRADWIQATRYLGGERKIESPRDLLHALADELRDYEEGIKR